MRRIRGKVGREIGSGRCTVASIVESSISYLESVNLIVSKPRKVLRKAGTRPSGKGMREMVTWNHRAQVWVLISRDPDN